MKEALINKALDDYKHCQQYGTVVKSPTGIFHVIENDESTITLCGQKFIINEKFSTGWELYEDYFFSPGDYSITCKKCRALEIKRMRLEIISRKDY